MAAVLAGQAAADGGLFLPLQVTLHVWSRLQRRHGLVVTPLPVAGSGPSTRSFPPRRPSTRSVNYVGLSRPAFNSAGLPRAVFNCAGLPRAVFNYAGLPRADSHHASFPHTDS